MLPCVAVLATLRLACAWAQVCDAGVRYFEGRPLTDSSSRGLLDVPASLGSDVHVLDLTGNSIAALADQFSGRGGGIRFPNLTALYVDGNRLRDLSGDCLSGLPELTNISLANNLIPSLPPAVFRWNQKLQFIDLSANRMDSLDPAVFRNLSRLRHLNVSHNTIKVLRPDTFSGLESLERLLISYNHISSLHPRTFRDLAKLDVLDASHNNISHLSPTLFFALKKMRVLDFSFNSMTKLPKQVFLSICRFGFINFSFNKIRTLYLSYTPYVVREQDGVNVLKSESGICSGFAGRDVPCFLAANQYSHVHYMDFSYNDVANVKFGDLEFLHSLEAVKIFLAGNDQLELPTTFIQKEKSIIGLYLDWTKLSWKNLTLINEILDLTHLKVLSIKGTEACNYFTRQLIYLVFNPNMRVNVICSGHHPADKEFGISSLSNTDSLNTAGTQKNQNLKKTQVSKHNGNQNNYPLGIEFVKTVINENMLCDFMEERIIFSLDFHIQVICENILDCSYLSLTIIPDVEPSFCVLLSHNKLKFLREGQFQHLSNVYLLDLSFNHLIDLTMGIFSSMWDIEFLKLDNNDITFINSLSFDNLTQLVYLTLHGNRISSHDSVFFETFFGLNYFAISFWNLSSFEGEFFFRVSNLKKLELTFSTASNNGYVMCNTSFFENICGLTYLYLSGLNFSTVLGNTFLCQNNLFHLVMNKNFLPRILDRPFRHLINLLSLSLNDNSIIELGKYVFDNLTDLRVIDFSSNKIESLPSNLFLHTNELIFLNMSHNHIYFLPKTLFEKLVKLTVLDLSMNPLKFLDGNIFNNLNSIKKLIIKSSNIFNGHNAESFLSNTAYAQKCTEKLMTEVYDIVQQPNQSLKNVCGTTLFTMLRLKEDLRELVISGITMKIICKHDFLNLTNLNGLFLTYNEIQEINIGSFTNLAALNILDLSHNHLKAIKNHVFEILEQLKLLDLSSNHIETLESEVFITLRALKYLFLHCNKLKRFDSNVLPTNTILEMLRLDNNLITLNNTSFKGLKFLSELNLDNNSLGNAIYDEFYDMSALKVLNMKNTNICSVNMFSFKNFEILFILDLQNSCVSSLVPGHFSSLKSMGSLDISIMDANKCDAYNALSWKNITLINSWFDLVELQYIILIGHPICEREQWTSIIENIFLSYQWKTVVCSTSYEMPKWILDEKNNGIMSYQSFWYFFYTE
ncbi:toll-like receptor 3 [Bacillus rossius redtenbacheri]|uniref:toll-like receptor 3 n=1 Tax=Bacillus rossius redtenbacheri TaxID=93214 RepID=UPI002FDD085D